MATEPTAMVAAAPVATVEGPVVLEAPEPVVVLVRVTLVGPPVAVVDRLPAGVTVEKVEVGAARLLEVELPEDVVTVVDEPVLETDPVAEEPVEVEPVVLLELVLPPVMWKGKEYWKMVVSESRTSLSP
jgi:hypothetical protein